MLVTENVKDLAGSSELVVLCIPKAKVPAGESRPVSRPPLAQLKDVESLLSPNLPSVSCPFTPERAPGDSPPVVASVSLRRAPGGGGRGRTVKKPANRANMTHADSSNPGPFRPRTHPRLENEPEESIDANRPHRCPAHHLGSRRGLRLGAAAEVPGQELLGDLVEAEAVLRLGEGQVPERVKAAAMTRTGLSTEPSVVPGAQAARRRSQESGPACGSTPPRPDLEKSSGTRGGSRSTPSRTWRLPAATITGVAHGSRPGLASPSFGRSSAPSNKLRACGISGV